MNCCNFRSFIFWSFNFCTLFRCSFSLARFTFYFRFNRRFFCFYFFNNRSVFNYFRLFDFWLFNLYLFYLRLNMNLRRIFYLSYLSFLIRFLLFILIKFISSIFTSVIFFFGNFFCYNCRWFSFNNYLLNLLLNSFLCLLLSIVIILVKFVIIIFL